MSGTKSIHRAGVAVLLALGASAAFCVAARAQESGQPSDQPATAFGYQAPNQFFINRMLAPPRPKADGANGPATGQGGTGGQAAAADDDDDDNVAGYGQNAFPKRYLLNKMFDFGGGDSAPPAAPAAAAPAATASAPAVKSP
jgi:hypothetical protein